MKKKMMLIAFIFSTLIAVGQEKNKAFKDGEWLRYKMSYSGFLKAGTAELTLKEKELNGKKVYHAEGKGKTTGMVNWFFKVKDNYQTFFDPITEKPYLFKRKINEGGYTKNIETTFNHKKNSAFVKNIKHKKDTTISVGDVQDLLSSFYYLRNRNLKNIKTGGVINLNIFMDQETFPLKLKFLGKETLKTKFGKVKTLKFRPLVQKGRIFKEKESVTVWITADQNKIPVKIKASLSVGSLRAELEAYKGLANSFEIVVN